VGWQDLAAPKMTRDEIHLPSKSAGNNR